MNFDFSKITDMAQPQLWSVKTIGVPSKKEIFFEKLSQRDGGATYANVHAVMLELIRNAKPEGGFETIEEMYLRG